MSRNKILPDGRKQCKQGHCYVGAIRCPECGRERKRNHYLQNKEKYNAASKEWFVANREKATRAAVEYRATNKEKVAQRQKKYRLEHIDAKRKYHASWAEQNREWPVWNGLIKRCTDKQHRQYPDYGGRGITVCDRWLGQEGYANFISDMGKRPAGKYTLDRKENDKGYFPENCHWVTQSRNNRNKRNNVMLTFKGKTQCVADWADETGVKAFTIYTRLNQLKWSVERTLTEGAK